MSYTSKVGIHCNKTAYEKLKKHLTAYPPTKTKTFLDEYFYLEWFWDKWNEDEDERVKSIMGIIPALLLKTLRQSLQSLQ